MAILTLKNLTFRYAGADADALKEINLEIEEGEFVVLAGSSGCGKSTLLRLIKRELAPAGERSGSLLFAGTETTETDPRKSAQEIGFVMQNPENQIVCDKVWHELAFGMENLGYSKDEIAKKQAELCAFFGIGSWLHQETDSLSGGQKQILNLAAVLMTDPKLLLLDEPTSMLDPVAASEFLALLKKINVELGITILMAEHRLEELFSLCGRVIIMQKAGIAQDGYARDTAGQLAIESHGKSRMLPAASRIFFATGGKERYPLSVKEGRAYLGSLRLAAPPQKPQEKIDHPHLPDAEIFALKNGYFRYERNLPDVLAGTDLSVEKGEFLCILGANGAGKSTLLRVLAGTRKLLSGKLKVFGRNIKDYKGAELYRGGIAMLPQDPTLVFVKSTLWEDLDEAARLSESDPAKRKERVDQALEEMGLQAYRERHPYDLSGGEQQRAAFAKLLLLQPKVFLLDEPTKGLDAEAKHHFGTMLQSMCQAGKTIVVVSHDVEFAAEYASRCAMFFDGRIVSTDAPIPFFTGNRFYTTAACRIARGFLDGAVTSEQVIGRLKSGVSHD